MSAFVLSKIFPSMNIDASQRFIFGLEGSPEPLGSFKLDNIFVPTMGSPSFTNFEMRNEALSGYRWIHGTSSAETYGSFKLQKFLEGSPTGIDIITFNNDGTFIIPGVNDPKYIIQTANANLPNAQSLGTLTTGLLKNTVTTGTGVLSTAVAGTDYVTLGNRLDQFAPPIVSLNLNSQKIINLANPTGSQDAVTRIYLDGRLTDITTAKFIIQTADADLLAAQVLGDLATGLLKNTTTTGVLTIGVAGTDYFAPSVTTAKLVVSGGVVNVGSEESCIRAISGSSSAKIEIQNTTASTGKLYELCSNQGGEFQIKDRTAANTRLTITSGGVFVVQGNLGVGGLIADSPIQIPTGNVTRKIVVNSSASNDHQFQGFGTIPAGLRYSISSSSSEDHLFFAGTSSTTSNELMRIQGDGIVAIGNTARATTARLFVNGGVQNVANEETAIRVVSALNNVKIELQSTGGSGKLYELRSSSTGNFDITDRTGGATRLTILTGGSAIFAGSLGLGGTTPNAQLQLSNAVTNRQLVLYEVANNNFQFHGFGSISGGLGYNINDVGDSHVFFAGVNSSSRNEVGRISGVGTFTTLKIQGKTSNVPGVAAGSAAGSSPTLSISGGEISGTFSVTAGTTPSGTLIATFTLALAMASANYGVVITPANQATASLATVSWINVTSTTQFTLNNLTPLVATTVYKWNYQILGV